MISFSLEKVTRYLNNKHEKFICVAIQLEFNNDLIKTGNYSYKIKSKNYIYEKNLYLDIENKKIQTIFSHEDPLILTDNSVLIALHIDIKEKILNEEFEIEFNKSNKVIYSNILSLPTDIKNYIDKDFSRLEDFSVSSLIDCTLRIHKGSENSIYSEEEYELKATTNFNFKDYIDKYEYVGVQLSAKINNVELEEKYIPIGQKNMSLSNDYYADNIIYYSLIDNIEKYKKLCFKDNEIKEKKYFKQIKETWKELGSINELLEYVKNKKVHFFEIDINFIKNQYINKFTYGINKTYSKKNFKNIKHIDLELCLNCDKNYKCLQLVPSGLSYDLYKENIAQVETKNCRIYNIISIN